MLACQAREKTWDVVQESFLEQQLQSYITWVNSQLKKKPEVQQVQDLRRDLRDGVVLASLIEIVAGEKLSAVEESPTNQQAMKENVEKVLQFVASKKIRMHQTSAKDIVDGNLKCIMRLVLALAAHFKPGSGKIASPGTVEEIQGGSRILLAHHRSRSAVAVAQEAVAALAEVRQDVSGVGRDAFQPHPRNSQLHGEIERPHWSVRALVQQYEGQQSSGPSESSFSSHFIHLCAFENFPRIFSSFRPRRLFFFPFFFANAILAAVSMRNIMYGRFLKPAAILNPLPGGEDALFGHGRTRPLVSGEREGGI
ncbi:dixin isoform X2 [Pantherophis guttatus]|uniref:Dixin isoform X2 n=1 Tax=Pantherophis guttatus TaxID=94885 RepID=A0ABM3ZRK0_PANGU|nr:dixin isoform X2 [Pantherophis guttatus]